MFFGLPMEYRLIVVPVLRVTVRVVRIRHAVPAWDVIPIIFAPKFFRQQLRRRQHQQQLFNQQQHRLWDHHLVQEMVLPQLELRAAPRMGGIAWILIIFAHRKKIVEK